MVDRREEQEVVIEPAIEVAIETVDTVVSRSDAATLTSEARRPRRSALAEHASPRGSLPSLAAAISAPTRADPDRPRSAIDLPRPARREPSPAFPVPGWERYTHPRLIGHGGMGIVFAVTDPRLRREVAIKFVRGDNPEHARRMVVEARAQACVRHACICEIHEVGEVDGRVYIAMQYVAGKPLAQFAGELSARQVAMLVRDAALGLHEAHRAGVIHRDVKPSNILIERSDGGELRPYVVDFGLARAVHDDGATQSGAILGTPRFMAPEQARGRSAHVDLRADVYGLGATLYYLLTGRAPIAGDHPMEVMTNLLTGEPPPPLPRTLTPGIPADLEAIVLKCLDRDRAVRYDSARALADDLGRFVDGAPVVARVPGAWYRARKRLARHRRALVAGGAAVVAVLAIAGWARARRELETVISDQVRIATTAFDAARQLASQRDTARERALRLFDDQRWDDGEARWSEVEELAASEASELRAASSHLEAALALDPTRASLRSQFADLMYARLLRAERDHQGELADEFAGRLAAYDDGGHRAALRARARVDLDVIPVGTRVWSERPGAARQLLGEAPLAPMTLPPGSVVLVFEAPGRVPARLPLLLARGETVYQRVALPLAGSAPRGMLFVPSGRFLFGSHDGSDLRRGFLTAAPMHEVTTRDYYIAQHEVTLGEWITFLDELAPDERRLRTPHAVSPQASLLLTEIAPRRWRLALTPTTRTYVAETGQRLHYEHRTRRADPDWTQFPVAAVSYQDALAYAAWLDHTGKLPGARLCDEREWERAARGADTRTFPGGDALAPDDANVDTTYGRDPLAFGPDEVGAHPASRSPFGADDMAGNVWEWTRSAEAPDAPVARGGSWYHGKLSARVVNREHGEPTQRLAFLGVRLCATPR